MARELCRKRSEYKSSDSALSGVTSVKVVHAFHSYPWLTHVTRLQVDELFEISLSSYSSGSLLFFPVTGHLNSYFMLSSWHSHHYTLSSERTMKTIHPTLAAHIFASLMWTQSHRCLSPESAVFVPHHCDYLTGLPLTLLSAPGCPLVTRTTCRWH